MVTENNPNLVVEDADKTLALIEQRLAKLGDLPIFSASLNKVRIISSDEDSDAMSLAVEVMKDANLTTKLLQLANSSVYNRGLGKITVISRAVVLLGFETIRSLCLTLKLIDSFHAEHRGLDMNSMLVNAFLTAGMAREVAEKAGIKDVEQSYICGLLHGLGEIIVAYALPEKYQHMQQAHQQGDQSWEKIQRDYLGLVFFTVGQKFAQEWGFGNAVVNTMKDFRSTSNKSLIDPVEMNTALASLSRTSLDLLYHRETSTDKNLGQVYQAMANAVGMSRADIEECMQQNFRNSCDLAADYGIDMKLLSPPVQESSDALLNKISRQLSFFSETRSADDSKPVVKQPAIDNKAEPHNKRQLNTSDTRSAAPTLVKPDLQRQLSLLQEITGLITSSAGVHHVFAKVLQGFCEGLGYQRAVLCLLNADHSRLQVRLGAGNNQDELKKYFNLELRDQRNLFIKVLREGNELLVDDIAAQQWQSVVPDAFKEQVASKAFSIAALRAGERIVGLFYADMAELNKKINTDMQNGFIQFVNQARLALQYAEMQRVKPG